MTIEFVPKALFAEVAGALGITTGEVFSAIPLLPDGATVIYTPGVTEENVETVTTYLAVLCRDTDDILRTSGEPVVIPDFFAKIKAGLAGPLGEEKDRG